MSETATQDAAALSDLAAVQFKNTPEPRRTVCLIQFYRGKIENRQKMGGDASDLIATYNDLLERYDSLDLKPPLYDIQHPYA